MRGPTITTAVSEPHAGPADPVCWLISADDARFLSEFLSQFLDRHLKGLGASVMAASAERDRPRAGQAIAMEPGVVVMKPVRT